MGKAILMVLDVAYVNIYLSCITYHTIFFNSGWFSVFKARDFVYTGFFVLFIYKHYLMHIVNCWLQILLYLYIDMGPT